jgi:hypothetical protein
MAYIKRYFLGIYWSDLVNSRLISAHTIGFQVEKVGRLRPGSDRFHVITTWKAEGLQIWRNFILIIRDVVDWFINTDWRPNLELVCEQGKNFHRYSCTVPRLFDRKRDVRVISSAYSIQTWEAWDCIVWNRRTKVNALFMNNNVYIRQKSCFSSGGDSTYTRLKNLYNNINEMHFTGWAMCCTLGKKSVNTWVLAWGAEIPQFLVNIARMKDSCFG